MTAQIAPGDDSIRANRSVRMFPKAPIPENRRIPTRAKVERIVARLDWHGRCYSATEACLDERISGVYDQAECADWTMGSVLARAQAGRRFCAGGRRPGMDRRPDPVASILATSRR